MEVAIKSQVANNGLFVHHEVTVADHMQKLLKKKLKKNCKTQSESDFHPLGRYATFTVSSFIELEEQNRRGERAEKIGTLGIIINVLLLLCGAI